MYEGGVGRLWWYYGPLDQVLSVSGRDKPLVSAKRLSTKANSVGKKKKRRVKESIETKRERKAWRTLAIITGMATVRDCRRKVNWMDYRYVCGLLDAFLLGLSLQTHLRMQDSRGAGVGNCVAR